MEKIEFRKVRDFGDLLNTTFAFIKQNIKKLFLSLLFIAGPAIFITGIAAGFYQSNIFSLRLSLGNFIPSALIYYFFIFITFQLILTVTYSYINLYLEKNLDEFDVNDVWENVKKNLRMVFLTTIGISVIVLFATILLIIPGIYLGIIFTIIYIVRIQEKLFFFESISRCRYLISGNWWFTFALLLIFSVIQYFFTFIFLIPQYIAMFIGMLHMRNGQLSLNSTFMMITSIIASVSYFFYAIVLIGISLHYFSLVEKKEATGLMEKLETI
jgi:hypothetical protein